MESDKIRRQRRWVPIVPMQRETMSYTTKKKENQRVYRVEARELHNHMKEIVSFCESCFVNSREKRICIAGSRTFDDIHMMNMVCTPVCRQVRWKEVITGDTFGADYEATLFASREDIPCRVYQTRSGCKDAKSTAERNEKLIRDCSVAILFWDGRSPGVRQKMMLATEMEKPVVLVLFQEETCGEREVPYGRTVTVSRRIFP